MNINPELMKVTMNTHRIIDMIKELQNEITEAQQTADFIQLQAEENATITHGIFYNNFDELNYEILSQIDNVITPLFEDLTSVLSLLKDEFPNKEYTLQFNSDNIFTLTHIKIILQDNLTSEDMDKLHTIRENMTDKQKEYFFITD